MQSLGPDFKNNSSSRFQISVAAVMLPGRNWTIETHSFSRFACRSSNQMFCQNFCGSFPVSHLRMCLSFFFFFPLPMSASKGWRGCFCVCVYTHKDFRVIICVVRPTFQRFVSHYCHLVELKWLHFKANVIQICLAQYTFFLETLKVGNEKENQENDDAGLMYFGDLENIHERDTFVFSTIVT